MRVATRRLVPAAELGRLGDRGRAVERLVAFGEAHPEAAVVGPQAPLPRRVAAALGARLPDALAARDRVLLPPQARAALARAERVLRRRLRPRPRARGRVPDGLRPARAPRGRRYGWPLRRGLLHVQRGDGLALPVPPGRAGRCSSPRRPSSSTSAARRRARTGGRCSASRCAATCASSPSTAGAREAERARRLLLASLRLRGLVVPRQPRPHLRGGRRAGSAASPLLEELLARG